MSKTKTSESPPEEIKSDKSIITSMDETSLRDIPSDWSAKRLEEITKDSLYGAAESAEDFDPDKPRYIRVTDLSEKTNNLKDKEPKSLSKDKISEKYLLSSGDMLFARSGSVGKTFYYDDSENEYAYGGYLIKFPLDESKVNPVFIQQYTHSPQYWNWVERITRTGAQPNINAREYSSLLIPIPPPEEQRKIATVLYNIDQAIQKTEEIIEQTKQVKKGLIQELTMKGVNHDNLKQINVTPGFLDIEVPKNWKKVSFKEITENITYGFTSPMPEAECGPWRITAKDIRNGKIHYEEASKTTQDAYDEKLTSKSRPEKGTVLVTKDGTLGRVGIVDRENICINQSVASLKPKTDRVIPEYLALTLKSPLSKKLIEAHNPQTTIGHIKISELAKWELALPPLDEQREIISQVNSVRNKLNSEKEHKKQLQRLKKGLMQDLLTGKVRTNDKPIEVLTEVKSDS